MSTDNPNRNGGFEEVQEYDFSLIILIIFAEKKTKRQIPFIMPDERVL
jgi:hypothetical protein